MSDTQNTAKLQTCLDTASPEIKPDARVAYTKGLVLGVDEFVQEQRYFLEKDYLHNRSLHGYGTVYGLAISISKTEGRDPIKDYPVTLNTGENAWLQVNPGVGVDQGGRTFVLRGAYCINLSTWWNLLAEKDKPTVSEDGKASIYIRARYDQRCDDLVAVAGQACSTDDMTSVNSRIYDSVILELSPVIPTMSAWDLSQRFAWLMSQVRFVSGIVFDDDSEKALVSYVKNWLGEASYNTKLNTELDIVEKRTGHRYFEFPETDDKTSDLLNDLNAAFLTNVAPKGYHDADDPYSKLEDADYDILLAEILLGGVAGNKSIASVDTDESKRPYLLGTQILQELLNINKHDKNRRRVFADLHVESSTSLLLWVHQPLNLASDAIQKNQIVLKRDGGELSGTIVSVGDFYRITLDTVEPHNVVSVGAPVELSFNLAALKDQNGKSLDMALFSDFVGLNEAGDVITIYAFADNLPVVGSLAAASTRRADDENQSLMLDVGFNMGTRVTFNGANGWQILKGQASITPTDVNVDTNNPALWHFQLPEDNDNGVQNNDLLTIQLDTQNIHIDGTQLSQLMTDGQYTLAGYDGHRYVNLPCIINAPMPYSDQQVEAIVQKDLDLFKKSNLDTLRTLPFATITPLTKPINPGKNDGFTKLIFEVWLHLSLVANANNGTDTVTLTKENLKIYLEGKAGVAAATVDFTLDPDKDHNNVINVVPSDQTSTETLNHLRFVFEPDQINLNTKPVKTLGDFIDDRMDDKNIKKNNIKFEGSFISSETGKRAIVVYVRNSLKANPPPVINLRAAAAPQAEVAVEEEAAAVSKLAKAAPKPRTRRAGGKS